MFCPKISLLKLCALSYIHTSVLGIALPQPGALGPAQSEDKILSSRAAFAGGIFLRIEPLGASITHGVASSDGNGYRKYLRDRIVSNGNAVDMVGSNPNGTMADNDNSGWPGLIIDEVHTKSNSDTPMYKPNLVLINLGTNDAIGDVDIANAGNRMGSLIADIYKQSSRATIILSGLIRNADSAVQGRAVQINSQFQNLAGSLRGQGERIVWANMQGSDGPSTSDLSPDGTHPLDQGYQKMATIWYNAIREADNNGFLKTVEG